MAAKQLKIADFFARSAVKRTSSASLFDAAADARAVKCGRLEDEENDNTKLAVTKGASGESDGEKLNLEANNNLTDGKHSANISTVETNRKPTQGPLPSGSPFKAAGAIANGIRESGWKAVLRDEFDKPYMRDVFKFVESQYQKSVKVFPPRELIFNAFNLTPFHNVRVVLIGQDPYHNDGQAHGLCFSVPKGIVPPPSLKNIYKELTAEYGDFKTPDHGCLEAWARQGVFMLNATLTVEAHKANSHSAIGWQKFTDRVIKCVSERSERGLVFLLWGGFAHKKEALIDRKRHRIIKTAHPSPLSYTRFKGCKCFSATNRALVELGREPVDWNSL